MSEQITKWDDMKALEGKWVTVTLDNNANNTATGTLIELKDDGECVLADKNGSLFYCWPTLGLSMEENEQPPVAKRKK